MKKIYIFLLSFMLLFGTNANAFAARKGSSHRSSTSYKSAKPKSTRVKSSSTKRSSTDYNSSNPKTVSVKGHYRKSGTYVQPYKKTSENKTVRDNYSYKGNYNPHTGKTGTKKYKNNKTSEYYDGREDMK
jgi:hypothetical protein